MIFVQFAVVPKSAQKACYDMYLSCCAGGKLSAEIVSFAMVCSYRTSYFSEKIIFHVPLILARFCSAV